MKTTKLIALLLFSQLLCLAALAQDSMEKVMEKRAREMHRVIGLTDKAQWKKFILENYTQALIDRPMRAKVETSDNGVSSSSSSEKKTNDNVEAKVGMFQQLHNDFGISKIMSIKPTGEKLEMVLKNDMGMNGTFLLKFDTKSPYLIDGMGIEVGEIKR